ncbi:MAG: symmetrical bis(5'-nucleosyl)-tetraphosphatase [Pseudomonadota bacterium]
MTTYAVGDIQGCRAELETLLEQVAFGAGDRLWLVGDLVNRGPDSLGTLRLLKSLGDSVTAVLGNHDLHLLAIRFGGKPVRRGDTLDDLLAAQDADELLHWLRGRPLLVHDAKLECVMTHAGVPHIWSLTDAKARAEEVEAVLRGDDASAFLEQLYGGQPDRWDDGLAGVPRLKLIANYFTRMRIIAANGQLDFQHKGLAADAPAGFEPWYALRRPEPRRYLFGHWASLEPIVDRDDIVALDTGCVWGRTLSGYALETGARISVPAAA